MLFNIMLSMYFSINFKVDMYNIIILLANKFFCCSQWIYFWILVTCNKKNLKSLAKCSLSQAFKLVNGVSCQWCMPRLSFCLIEKKSFLTYDWEQQEPREKTGSDANKVCFCVVFGDCCIDVKKMLRLFKNSSRLYISNALL